MVVSVTQWMPAYPAQRTSSSLRVTLPRWRVLAGIFFVGAA